MVTTFSALTREYLQASRPLQAEPVSRVSLALAKPNLSIFEPKDNYSRLRSTARLCY